MNKLIDLTGKKFGKLTVVSRGGTPKGGDVKWNCICECGGTSEPQGSSLRSGNSKSCGCMHPGSHKPGRRENGLITSEYRSWLAMKGRCTNKNSEDYNDYGGRGITVCESWLNSFETFLKDMGKKPSIKHSIDRIDNNKGYSPENCRWATYTEQSNNRRSNYPIIINGITKNLLQWAKEYKLSPKTLRARINRGCTLDDSLFKSIPLKELTIQGETKTILQWEKDYKLPPSIIRSRIYWGWPIDESLLLPSRLSTVLTIKGETKTLTKWAKDNNLSEECLRSRVKKGWHIDETILQSSKPKELTINGKIKSLAKWGEEYGLSSETLRNRIKAGWSINETILQPPKAKKAKVDTV